MGLGYRSSAHRERDALGVVATRGRRNVSTRASKSSARFAKASERWTASDGLAHPPCRTRAVGRKLGSRRGRRHGRAGRVGRLESTARCACHRQAIRRRCPPLFRRHGPGPGDGVQATLQYVLRLFAAAQGTVVEIEVELQVGDDPETGGLLDIEGAPVHSLGRHFLDRVTPRPVGRGIHGQVRSSSGMPTLGS